VAEVREINALKCYTCAGFILAFFMQRQRFRQVLQTHCHSAILTPRNPDYARQILEHTYLPLLHDLGTQGDLTSKIILDKSRIISAKVVSKNSGILAGMQELSFFLGMNWLSGVRKPFGSIKIKMIKSDGDSLRAGDTLCILSGQACDILKIERAALNLLQRMSGIATFTQKHVKKVPKSVLVTPTRKTLWGLLDKKACVVGGGGTHRMTLDDAVLVKDTHLDLISHDFYKLFMKIKNAKNVGRFIEIEVSTARDAYKAFQAYSLAFHAKKSLPLYMMLDNIAPAAIRIIVRKINGNARTPVYFEASGNINIGNISSYAKTGVDIISIGALTHSAPALDISLKISR